MAEANRGAVKGGSIPEIGIGTPPGALTDVKSGDRVVCYQGSYRVGQLSGSAAWEYQRMAQVKSHKYPQVECGDIYFLYRPAVGVDEAHGFRDVRRLYILLKPWSTQMYRLLIVGRKKLPAPEEHDRFWAFVWRVYKDRAALNDELGYEEYETKTRGVRKIPAARPAAEGIYTIVRHGEHTHLAYFLELPKHQGPVERELNIGVRRAISLRSRIPKSRAHRIPASARSTKRSFQRNCRRNSEVGGSFPWIRRTSLITRERRLFLSVPEKMRRKSSGLNSDPTRRPSARPMCSKI